MVKVLLWGVRLIWWTLGAIVALVLGGMVLGFVWDVGASFWSWRTLTKSTIQEEAVAYTQLYRIENVGICVYELDCSSGRAGLRRVSDFYGWDLQASLDRTWQRRFSDVCPGRTANLGLHLVPLDSSQPTGLRRGTELARWNFGTDRFLARSGNFSGGAFSELPYQACSSAAFIATVGAD